MRNPWSLVVVLAVALAGCAQPLDSAARDAVAIEIAPYNVGDRFTFEQDARFVIGGDPQEMTRSFHFEIAGRARAEDWFGIERPAWLIRSELFRDDPDAPGEPFLGYRSECYLLAGGREELRRDVHDDHPAEVTETLPPLGLAYLTRATEYTRVVHRNCDVPVDLGGRTLAEGERLGFQELASDNRVQTAYFWWGPGRLGVEPSDPAAATLFHGRPALNVTFRVHEPDASAGPTRYDFTFTFADGLPGIVAWEARGTNASGTVDERRDELTAYEKGLGEPLVDENARLPAVDPSAPPVAADLMRFDDGPWPIGYRFDDAVATLRADPRIGLDAYFASHPQAVLMGAVHATGAHGEEWWLAFGDDAGAVAYSTQKPGLRTRALPLPVALNQEEPLPEGLRRAPPAARARAPGAVAPASVVAAAAERGGVAPADTAAFGVWLGERADGRVGHTFAAIDQPAEAGVYYGSAIGDPARAVTVDARSGGLQAMATFYDAPTSPLGRAVALGDPADPADVPRWRQEPHVVVAGGLLASALLALAARSILLPAYTRLVRGSLLTNPPARASIAASGRSRASTRRRSSTSCGSGTAPPGTTSTC